MPRPAAGAKPERGGLPAHPSQRWTRALAPRTSASTPATQATTMLLRALLVLTRQHTTR